jgi:glycosyltransferase involved in cell wall biosynthesis
MLKIAFVSSNPHPTTFRLEGSYVYRCENLALGLSALGHQVSHHHLNSLVVGRLPFDLAVFLRPTDSLRMRWVTRRLRQAKCRMVADFDDLLFDPSFARFRPSVWSGQASLARTTRKFLRHSRVLRQFDAFTFSTQSLFDHFAALHPDSPRLIVPNAAFRPWRGLQRIHAEPRRITYFSGTRTHDRDFALVEPALARLLEERDDIHIQLVGPLQTRLDHRHVERVERVDFKRYADLVRSAHLNLAPLEDTPFNRCKSALKAIEAGCFGIPTLASPIGDYLRVATEGVLYAGDADQWYEQLRLALDEAHYRRLSEGLVERLRPLSDVDRFAREFLSFVG